MLNLQTIQNMRVFLKRLGNGAASQITGEETVAHALCLQALEQEEAELNRQARNAKIAADAKARAALNTGSGDDAAGSLGSSALQKRIEATNAAVGE